MLKETIAIKNPYDYFFGLALDNTPPCRGEGYAKKGASFKFQSGIKNPKFSRIAALFQTTNYMNIDLGDCAEEEDLVWEWFMAEKNHIDHDTGINIEIHQWYFWKNGILTIYTLEKYEFVYLVFYLVLANKTAEF